LLDPNSLLARNGSGLNVVLIRLEDWATSQPDEIERKLEDLTLALKSGANRSAVPFLVCFCPSAKASDGRSESDALFERMEKECAANWRQLGNVYVVTTAELFDLYPVAEYYDPQGDELGHVPYTPAFFTALATMIARRYHALKQPPCKVMEWGLRRGRPEWSSTRPAAACFAGVHARAT